MSTGEKQNPASEDQVPIKPAQPVRHQQFSFNTWNHSTYLGLEPTLPAQIRAAADAGYEFIGFDIPSLVAHAAAGVSFKEIGTLVTEAGLSVYELAPLSLSSNPTAVRNSLAVACEAASALEAQQVYGTVFGEPNAGLVDSIRHCVDQLGALGVGTAVEFLPTRAVNSIAAAVDLVAAVDRPGFGLVLDTWHFFQGPSTWESLEQFPLNCLAFVQFDDAIPATSDDLSYELMHRRALPGEGVLDLARFCQVLRDRGFEGVVSVEVLSAELRDLPIDEFARRSLVTTRPYWE